MLDSEFVKNIFKLAAVLVFISLVFTNYQNIVTMHTHKLADGRIITHSHALPTGSGESNNSQNGNQHSHTSVEFTFIQIMSFACLAILAIFFLLYKFEIRNQFFVTTTEEYRRLFTLTNISLRAPPVPA